MEANDIAVRPAKPSLAMVPLTVTDLPIHQHLAPWCAAKSFSGHFPRRQQSGFGYVFAVMVLGRSGCLHNGQDLVGRLNCVFALYGALMLSGLQSLLMLMCIILVSSAARISSSRDVMGCEISGFMEARVRDLNSVPYLCFTSLGSSGWISLSQARVMKFSNVGMSSSLSMMTSPWWVRLLARSIVSSTYIYNFAKSRKWTSRQEASAFTMTPSTDDRYWHC